MKRIFALCTAGILAVFFIFGISAGRVVILRSDADADADIVYPYQGEVHYVFPAAWCHYCQAEEPYVLEYEPWTEKQHVIRHWCLGCGYDQLCGVAAEEHRWDGDICRRCGEER